MTTTNIYSIETFDPQRAVGRLLSRTRHALLEKIGDELKPLDLSAAQWGVVVLLADNQASKPNELSYKLDYDPGAMTRLIDRLVKKGYVLREEDRGDRRSVNVSLTELGRAQYPAILPKIVNVYNVLLAGFTKEEARQFEDFLLRILDNAERSSPGARPATPAAAPSLDE